MVARIIFSKPINLMRFTAVFAMHLLLTWPTMAGPGDMDRSFAPGEAITCLGESGQVTAMAVMSDGSAIMGGQVIATSFIADSPFVMFRLRPEGVPEQALNERGITWVGSQVSVFTRQVDGRLIGGLNTPGIHLFRLNQDGTPDASFTAGELLGSADPDYGGLFDVSMAALNDGRSIVAGVSNSGGALRRVFAGGGHDASFGTGGVARHALWPKCLAVQPNGKILVGGKLSQPGGGGTDFAIVRFSADGVLDSSFGMAGTAVVDLGSSAETCLGLLVLADGRLIATGQSGSTQVVARFTSQGILDPGFGNNGHAVSPFSRASIALQPLQGDSESVLVIGRHDSDDVPPVSSHHLICYTSTGAVHPGFGTNGVVKTGRALATGDDTAPRTFGARLANGSILLGRPVWNGFASNFRLIRIDAAGATDTSYGGGQIRLAGTDSVRPNRSPGRHLGLLPNGCILLPSRNYSSGSDGITQVHAFLTNGLPDLGFGSNGVVSMSNANDLTVGGAAFAALPDGRFALAGPRTNSPSWAHSLRFTSGEADPGFNSGLVAYSPVATTSSSPVLEIAFDADERLVSAGYATVSGSNTDVVLTRHLPDGSLDPTFGQNGIVTTHVATSETAFTLDLLPDGRLLVGGGSGSSPFSPSPLMIRYQSNGTLDPTFGNGGVLASFAGAPPRARITDVALLPDGRFLAVMSSPASTPSDKPALFCFQHNGSLDPAFGSGGRALDFPPGVNGSLQGVATQKDGRIVVAGGGSANDLLVDDVVVWRYESNGVPDTSFGHLGRRFFPVSGYTDSGTSVAISPDNKIIVTTQSNVSSERVTRICGVLRLEGGPLLANLAIDAPTDRSGSGVRLRGTVNPNGFATTALFEYGLTASYGQSVPLTLIDEDGTVTENVETLLSGLSGSTTYHYRLTATTAAGTRSTPDSTFSTFSSLETWRQTHFGSADNTGSAADAADFDLDGVPNLIEWACGLSPSMPSRFDTPVNVNASVIEFTYTRDTAAIGAVYQVEWSDTLPGSSWSAVGVSETVLGLSGTIQTVKATLPAGSNSSRFVRLKVQGPL